MSAKTLYLAWQEKREQSRLWYPVGRLDADVECSHFRFRYTRGAERAKNEVGFPLLLEFPELREDYRSRELFPLFRNRVIAPGRPDRTDYLRSLDLKEDADPVEILSVNGGSRATDAYEVFPKLTTCEDGRFTCRFFLYGWRHMNRPAQARIDQLAENDELYVTLELTNPATELAVQIQTVDYYVIGWAPRYLVRDLAEAMAKSPKYAARVVRVNPLPAPSKQRVLVEMSGFLNGHEPMKGEEFDPLVE